MGEDRLGPPIAYFFTAFRVEQDPAKLNTFGRVLCNVDAVFVTSGSNVLNDVSVKLCLIGLGSAHCLFEGSERSAHRAGQSDVGVLNGVGKNDRRRGSSFSASGAPSVGCPSPYTLSLYKKY